MNHLTRRRGQVVQRSRFSANPFSDKLYGLLAAVSLLPSCLNAAERVFDVIPTDRLPFNYPDPPREGAVDHFPIAKNGQARCVIVRSASAPRKTQSSISALREYLRLTTGAAIRVLTDQQPIPEGMAAIHVGDTTLGRATPLGLPELRYGSSRFPNLGGFLVKTLDSRTLLIRGPNEAATAHGIVGFLKRYAGVRQYWPGRPGDLGDVIPQRPSLTLPEVEWRDWPYFFSRIFSLQAFPRGGRPPLDFYRRHQTLPSGENYNRWLPPGRHAQSHPEYYALVNGKRLQPSDKSGAAGWQPCVSNPEVVRIMGDAVVDYFRENPEAPGINFAINDGGGNCTCPQCQAMDAPGTDYSRMTGMGDRYVKFTNRICEQLATEHPNKWLVYLAYAGAKHPPSTVQPHSQLLPVLTTSGSMFASWDAWMKAGTEHMGLYLHHDDLFFILPKLDVRQTAKRIRYTAGSGRARVFYMEMHNQWPFADTVPYITSELLWDPRQNVDTLLNEYYEQFYGPAAAPMQRFHQILESNYERWLATDGAPHWHGPDINSIRNARSLDQFKVLPPEAATRAARELSEAARLAKADKRITERVQLNQAMFTLQEMGVRWAWATFRLREAKVDLLEAAQRVVADARLVHTVSREMRRYIEGTLEQPPLDRHKFFRTYRQPTAWYEEMKSGEPGAEVMAAVTAGIQSAGKFLKSRLGPEKAAAWWQAMAKSETEPALTAAFQTAAKRAAGAEMKNLVPDPGFEEIGKRMTPDEFALERDILLDPDQVKRIGIHHWFAERSPYRCILAEKDAYSGRYALMMEHCHRARFSRHAKAKPGERFRVSLWFRRNEGQGRYKFEVDTRASDRSYPVLAAVPLTGKPGEWREYVAEVAIPPKASGVFLKLYVNGQAADARCWIDDVFIGK